LKFARMRELSTPRHFLCRSGKRKSFTSHTEEHTMLRSISDSRFDPDQIPSRSIVNRLGTFQMPGELADHGIMSTR
jgi:hypothetical protein